MTSGLKNVTIPTSVTSIGANAFSSDLGSWIGKKVTINYAGTKAEWDAVNKPSDWQDGLEDGSTVVCSDGVYTLKTSGGILGFGKNYTWTWKAN